MSDIAVAALRAVLAVHIPSPDPASSTVVCTDCPSGKAHGWFRGWTAWHTHIVEVVTAANARLKTEIEHE